MNMFLIAQALSDAGAGFNTNSIVIAASGFIMLGAIGWVGRKSSDNNDKLTSIGTSLPYIQRDINELKAQMNSMVTRPELESKIAQINVDQAQIKVEQAKIQADIIRIQQHLPRPD